MREEKRSFLEYQRATTELERLTRLAKAFEWQQLRQRNAEKQNAVEDYRTQTAARTAEEASLRRQIDEIEKELDEIEKKREHDMKKGGKLPVLIEENKRLNHEIVKENTQIDFKVASLEDEEKKATADESAYTALQKARADKAIQLEKLGHTFGQLKADFDEANDALSKQDELLQTLLTGMASRDSGDKAKQGGYMGQLAEAREREAAAGTEIEQANLRIKHLEKELKTKEPQARKAEKEGASLLQELATARESVSSLQQNITATGWDDGKEKELQSARAETTQRINQLLEQKDRVKSRLAGMDFTYADPEPNFDRSRVKGLVASLVQLDAGKEQFSTALEICAGSRLYNVVVEDERTGSQLLTNGKLKKRVTLIPLNKISATVAAAQRIGAAQKIAPGKVDLALTLVGYDDEVSRAMEFVFGNTLICADAATAKSVTFDNSVRMKSVTLEGDVYDPAGTLSGGSKPSSAGVLVKVQELTLIERALNDARATLAKCETDARAAKEQIVSYNKLKRQLDLKAHQVTLLESQVEGSNATRIIAEVESHKKTVQELQDAINEAKAREVEASNEAKKLEKDMEDFNNNKDNKLEELRADIKKRKNDINSRSANIKTRQNEVRTLELELEESARELEAAQNGLQEGQLIVEQGRREIDAMREGVAKLQGSLEEVEETIQAEKKVLSAYDSELDKLRTAVKSKKQEIADGQLSLKKYAHEKEKAVQECLAAEKAVKQLEAQFEWIADEQGFFGKPGTAYDFGKHNMNEVRRACRKLEEQQSGMRQRVNPKVLNMIDSVEKKESELKTMMATVLKDKNKIEETILELDRYKKDALQTTWEKVNGDFGEIFAELLPGNYSKLQPPEGQDVTQGLEVKVRLGSVWKQSLTELSGGQRSLIALSLIMSLLQFKPAPMYILDEIDAALDLSHTQHIGQLFQSRFSGSQFIVVSLKEGLFTNANVLFRARFRDGTR